MNKKLSGQEREKTQIYKKLAGKKSRYLYTDIQERNKGLK